MIEIRLIQSHEEYRAVEQLQRAAWGLAEVEVVPHHMLVTIQKNGGLLLGAFEPCPQGGERMVGFVLGFPGRTPDGRAKHCSQMAGVLPDCQNRNIGYRLKLAQRECVLGQGLDWVTWTFDPLESRNAQLNFRKLGATCRTYLRDFYGDMRDALNAGMPSDRFQVDWHVASSHVTARLDGRDSFPTLSERLAAGAALLNPLQMLPPPLSALPENEWILVQIPADFQALKSTDVELARAWRLQTRALFETAFAAGYTATDLLFEKGKSYYLLRNSDSAPIKC
ncbi:MAG: hypothetical protein JW900_14595 [Anaerolineae bacterium]|nr:hypothetical protein [Anaerolineae bacterium]